MEKRIVKDHDLFKPKSFEDGRHAVVGDCNGFTMEERWAAETPVFARAILRLMRPESTILDYGCGVGRLAKEIITQDETVFLTGTDASGYMLERALEYVNDVRFSVVRPYEIEGKFDLAYLVYVLQHVPAIEIREVLSRIHYHLKDDGFFVYCSSDYRMAIRYDGGGFFDDRFLGVDLRAEIERYFHPVKDLFTQEDYASNPIVRRMVTGKTEGCDDGLAHPAIVYRPRKLSFRYFDVARGLSERGDVHEKEVQKEKEGVLKPSPAAGSRVGEDQGIRRAEERAAWEKTHPKRILLFNRLSPGDILVMTNAIRDLHLAYPGEYITDVRSPANDIFTNSPYITKLEYSEARYEEINTMFKDKGRWEKAPEENTEFIRLNDGLPCMALDTHYPLIHSSGVVGSHFSEGHRDFFEKALGVKIPQTDLRPQIFLSETEKNWPSPALVDHGVSVPYWVINAGSKDDASLKQYPYFQEVVDLLMDEVKFIQIGQKGHNHRALNGVVDMVGQTNIRSLFRLIYHAHGVLTCVSFPMHIAAAFSKPCVVVAGAREGTRWELYPNHQFLYVNGCLVCAPYDGCWRAKFGDCDNKIKNVPRCMTLIKPEDVANAIMRYYAGGILEWVNPAVEVARG